MMPDLKNTTQRGQLLVAIMNDRRDMAIAREQGWYRIPVSSVEKRLKHRWPPRWLAFYQTKTFDTEKYSVRYYAKVLGIQKQYRWQLFPNEPEGKKTNKLYYQVLIGPLKALPQPIASLRWRRIVFIPTTWEKFVNATEINDLFDDSPLEDRLWTLFKQHRIHAERQKHETVGAEDFFLDFAIYCLSGKIDVETDGDTWHANPKKAAIDNLRNNTLEAAGWSILRYNTKQINEEAETYCLPNVVNKINDLGGLLDKDGIVPHKIDPDAGVYQPSLFD